MDYKLKYLKYKEKYFALKNQLGGTNVATKKLKKTLNHILNDLFKPSLLTEPQEKNVELFTLAIGNAPLVPTSTDEIKDTINVSLNKFFKADTYNKKTLDETNVFYRNILCFDKFQEINLPRSRIKRYLISQGFVLVESSTSTSPYENYLFFKNDDLKMKIAFVNRFFPTDCSILSNALDFDKPCKPTHNFYLSLLNYLKNTDGKRYTTHFSIYNRAIFTERNNFGIRLTLPDGREYSPDYTSGNIYLEKLREILYIAGRLSISSRDNNDTLVEIVNTHDGVIKTLPRIDEYQEIPTE
jgi:hypothetical protein